jgi:hypothetical protein
MARGAACSRTAPSPLRLVKDEIEFLLDRDARRARARPVARASPPTDLGGTRRAGVTFRQSPPDAPMRSRFALSRAVDYAAGQLVIRERGLAIELIDDPPIGKAPLDLVGRSRIVAAANDDLVARLAEALLAP